MYLIFDLLVGIIALGGCILLNTVFGHCKLMQFLYVFLFYKINDEKPNIDGVENGQNCGHYEKTCLILRSPINCNCIK